MRKTTRKAKKLEIHRDTLRRLAEAEIPAAVGGQAIDPVAIDPGATGDTCLCMTFDACTQLG